MGQRGAAFGMTDGSIGLLVSAMARRNDLTRSDIDELYAILQKAEEEMK